MRNAQRMAIVAACLFCSWPPAAGGGQPVELVAPRRLQFVQGEPMVIPLTFRNKGTKTSVVSFDEFDIAVGVKKLDSGTGAGICIIQDEPVDTDSLDSWVRESHLEIAAGRTRAERVYLGHCDVRMLPPGTYRLTVRVQASVQSGGAAVEEAVYHYAAELAVREDAQELEKKLQELAQRAVQAEETLFGPGEFVDEINRYDPRYSMGTKLRLVETRWRELKRTSAELLFSIISSLLHGHTDEPRPVVRRLAALRRNSEFPDDLKKRMDFWLRDTMPARPVPKVAAAVKEEFGISLKACERWGTDYREDLWGEWVLPEGVISYPFPDGPVDHDAWRQFMTRVFGEEVRSRWDPRAASNAAQRSSGSPWWPAAAALCGGGILLALAFLMIRRARCRERGGPSRPGAA